MQAQEIPTSLTETIEELRAASGGPVAIDDVAGVVSALMTTIQGDLSASDLRAHDELEDLVRYIESAREEIVAIRPDSIRSEEIPTAHNELGVVVDTTAEATGVFLDVAEQLETLADRLGGAEREMLGELVTRIYEASNFQDITGQRITKVVNIFAVIEAKVGRLCGLVEGREVDEEKSLALAQTLPRDGRPDAELLNGPAMPETANNQDDIDALLASFD